MSNIKYTIWYNNNKNTVDELVNEILNNVKEVSIPKSFGYEFYVSEDNLRDALLLHIFNYSHIR
jgi:hypothetical protein